MQNFVHLRMHTEFSITDGILRIPDAVKRAFADRMVALAITDLHNVFGLVKFYKSSRENGIKPVIGAEVNIISAENLNYRVILLAKNIAGYRQLCELLTRSYIENKIAEAVYIKEEWLLQNVNNNLIVLSGAQFGDIGKLLFEHKFTQAYARARLWAKAFPNSYYIELQRISVPEIEFIVAESVKLADQLNLPLVATHPIQFAVAQDYIAHELRVCIADGTRLDDESRVAKFAVDQYFLTQAEMQEKFSDIPSSIANTLEIAKRCTVEITLGEYFLPNFEVPNGIPLNDYLRILANTGLQQRLAENFTDVDQNKENIHIYEKRLQDEIEIIIQMGFAGYFLIVADLINWAKSNNVPVGPGRGSGAGSLVAFSLGITDVDPLRYGLLFERFLNPERISMPDFDIDFCQDKRHLVIEYVKNKYGSDAVAQIATFGTMSSKAVIKDVGRALSLPYGLCDSISKLIINTPAKSYSLLEAYDKFIELKEKIDNADEEVSRLWELCLQLEDIVRSVGKHAAGLLIAPSKLTNFCPLYLADGMQTSQLDKDDVELIGLVKFDFLGLRNLTIIEETLNNIKLLYNQVLHLSNYDFNDATTYALLQKGNASAVFQLESLGMRRILAKLEPDRLEDIIAILALYRPGPLGSGMVDDFIKRKKGEASVNYYHEDLRVCLESTYGIILYQEQVMQISQIIGGYSLGKADLLRKAMGKKKPEEMAKHKDIFVNGAVTKGYTRQLAEELFDLMAIFAEYGFNKAHSTAYAFISYHTAYLKANYMSCFMASTLSSELDRTDKLYEFYQDCVFNGIKMLPPNINESNYRFQPIDNKTIRYALGAIKGVGKNIVSQIVSERDKNGKFSGLVNFCLRVDRKILNRKVLEGLIKSGAFDELVANRAQLFHNLTNILEGIEAIWHHALQGSLFDELCLQDNEVTLSKYDDSLIKLDEYAPWSLKEQLIYEKAVLGYYLSGSLFDEYAGIVRKLEVLPLSQYTLSNENMQEVVNSTTTREKLQCLICGIVTSIGFKVLKRGKKMVFVQVEDDTGFIEAVFFGEDYDKYVNLLKIDEFIFIEGELMYDSFRNQIKIMAKCAMSIDDILIEKLKGISIQINKEFNPKLLIPMLNSSGIPLTLYYANDTAKCTLELGDNYRFVPTYANIGNINLLLGQNRWHIQG